MDLSRLSVRLPAVSDLMRSTVEGPASGSRELGLGGPPGATAELLTADVVDEPVTIVNQPLPTYPAALAAAGIAGRVVLEYVVDTTGRAEPASLRVLESAHAAFASAAKASVLASRFRPARLRGSSVRQLVRQALSFRPISRLE